jgi:hypothetical protein
VLILRDKHDRSADDSIWLATTHEHHDSLRREFPSMRSIQILGKKVSGWQGLPSDSADFENAAMRACELIIPGDERIGKIPSRRKKGNTRVWSSPSQRKRDRRA